MPQNNSLSQIDCKAASARICDEVLTNSDFQLGRTKVFLKDEQELFLEQERDKALAEKILILQKHIKGILVDSGYNPSSAIN